MIVSHERRILFVHVQKTGGSSVDRLLQDLLPDAAHVKGLPGTRHAKLGPALRRHPEFHDYFIFGFVRNPWARLFSWHSMIMRRVAAADEGNAAVRASLSRNNFWQQVASDYTSFEDFVLRGTREIGRLTMPQLAWLRSPARDVDFIGRTEDLAGDLASALTRAGLTPPRMPLEQRNAGPRLDYREHYSASMRQRVAEVFAPDIDEFGYTF